MDNTPDWDSLSDTPPLAPPVPQDRSAPIDSQVADFADEANRRVAAGEDPAAGEADLHRKVESTQSPRVTAGGKKASTLDWDSLSDTPPKPDELTSQYQPIENWSGQVYNSPSAALAQPDQFQAGSQVQGVGDYLENLGAESGAKLRKAAAGIVQGVGEIPEMARDIAAKFGTFSGSVQGGVPPSAVFTAAAQARGTPADNVLAQTGQFEAQKAAREEEQAAGHLVPAPDENTGGLGQTAYYTQEALTGAPTVAAAMAAGPVGGAALFGAQTAGEQYATKRLSGEAPVSAAASSGIEGAVSALTASLSLESALNPGAIGALRRIAETTGSVEAQSVINEATSIAAEQSIDGKEMSADEIKNRLIGAAKGGIPAGVIMGGIGAATHGGDAADTAAANVRRLAENLAPTEVPPTLEERVNAREIPQDQGILPGEGAVQEGGGEARGEGVQFGETAGNAAGDAEQQVAPAPAAEGVPFMVTQAMKRDLRAAGYTDADIRQMTPQDAHDALRATNERPAATPPETPGDADAARTTDAVAAREEGLPSPFYARAETAGVDDAREAQDAAKAWREQGTDSPYFQRYFEGSKVVDADGEPLVVHHGTGEDFAAFEGEKAGESTGHMTAPLGHFFAVDRGSAERYAEKAAQGVPADERVIDAYLSIKNPKDMSLDQFMAIDSQDEARALRAQLQQQGYDGIHLTDAGKGQWIAFDPAQIKDVGNRGTFDTGDARMKYAAREGAPQTDNLTRDEARQALAQEFGATALRKLEANGLNLVGRDAIGGQTQELTPQQRAGVKGFTPPDRSSANVVHDNVTRQELPETVIHEVVHANLDRILPEATRNALASAIQARARQSPEVKAALDAIPKTTPKGSYREEVLAQSMGNLYTQPVGRRVMDAFKLGLNRMGVPLDWINAHEAAIRQIGIENLRHYAEAPRRAPVTTFQMPSPGAPPPAGTREEKAAPAAKPRVRLTADQVLVNRVEAAPVAPERTAEAAKPPEAPRASAEAAREPSPEAIGTKNAAKAAERAVRGLEPVVSELRPNEKAVWDAALKRREDDPTVGYLLSADLAKNPRPVSSEDEALLMQHGAELHNRYDDVLQRIETAQRTGNDADAVNAQMDRMAIEQDLATNEKATKEIGTEWSATGRMRQKLAERDFSMARQVLRFKAITGVDDLPQRLRDQIAQHVKTIQAREAELAKALAENQGLREAAPPVARRRIAPAEKKSLDDEFDALAKRAAEIRQSAAIGTRYARVEDPELAAVIRRMARNRSDAGETDPDKVLAAIHEATGVPHRDVADTITSNQPYRKQTLSELQQRYNDLKRALRDPAVQRDAAQTKRLQSQLAEIKSRIQRKDYSTPEKTERPEKPPESETVRKLRQEIAKAKNELNGMAARQERLNDTRLGKTLRTIVDAKIFNILASVSVYKKLLGAAVTRNASQISEEALGTVLAKLPGLRKYAAYSPRYGGRGFWAGLGEFGKGVVQAFARAKEDLQQNQNRNDILYGHKRISQEFTDFSGRMADALRTPGVLNKTMETVHSAARFIGGTHAAIKEFVSEPEMNVAAMQIGRYTREQLLKKNMTPDQIEEYMSRESTQASIQAQAYEHSLESKFQGKNFLTDNVNALLSRMERSGGIAGKVGAFLAKEEFPVRGIPMNIAKELLTSYPFGALKAMAKMTKFDNLPEAQKPAAADYIMKNLRKQGIGAITIALGGYLGLGGASGFQLGGVPRAEKKDKNAPIKPGEAMVAGQNVGTQIMHGPLPELLELGASLARVYQREYGSKGFTAMLESLAQVYPTLALQSIPYTDQPMRQARTVENAQKYDHRSGYDKLLGEMIRANVVPAGVQQYARGEGVFEGMPGTDPYKGFRNARNIPEDVKLGVPGLREQVPQSRR